MIKFDKIVHLTEQEFREMNEYSLSLPTGVTIGKVWKGWIDGTWHMGEYRVITGRSEIEIKWREIRIWREIFLDGLGREKQSESSKGKRKHRKASN